MSTYVWPETERTHACAHLRSPFPQSVTELIVNYASDDFMGQLPSISDRAVESPIVVVRWGFSTQACTESPAMNYLRSKVECV